MDRTAYFDYERVDIDILSVLWIAVGLGAFVLIVPLLMPLAFPQSMQHLTPAAPPALTTDAPRLAVAPRNELQQLRRGDAQFADSYGWTDRSRGIVHIPVKRAMELLLQKGLPGWPSQ
jgi:hypothetical protein